MMRGVATDDFADDLAARLEAGSVADAPVYTTRG